MITAVEVTIKERRSAEGHPFSEIFYTVTTEDGGPPRHALTRLWFPVADTAYQRNYQAQQYTKRSDPAWGAQ